MANRDPTQYCALMNQPELIPALIPMLDQAQIRCIQQWPRELGGGPSLAQP